MTTTSMKDVARAAGVSVGTVSNVLNRPEAVAEETRRRVQTAIAKLGYVRNDSARQLRAGRSRNVAIVVLDVANPFFTDVVRGAEPLVDSAGGVVTVCDSGEDVHREQRHLEILEEQRVLGLLITPVDGSSSERLERLTAHDIPVVLVDRGAGQHPHCSVAVDDVYGGRTAAAHLVERGHTSIAFIGGPIAIPQVGDRLAGCRAVCEEAGIHLEAFTSVSLNVAGGREAIEQMLGLPEVPTAVFCANDLVALGALQGLTMHGVKVPEECAIIGYDDIDFAAAAAVPLSSVRQPRSQLGRTAAQLLFDEIAEGEDHTHRNVVFQPELVARASTAAAL
ncbi:LacI family DNA-binding transcriptional regulator [Glycomyces buryatensis]|uniref:LacI family transcriptional regulator n=1 Tax=Glycomyces buryatensis TaxID=2570927 RepID=A0A4S8PZK7_9ACTN|nr:LacI family DNA-binding transcriptional regulator [Glycomyces buryatensis]THV33699.1 LacI family transcriptional regulator [Glycomyces buryatensis]